MQRFSDINNVVTTPKQRHVLAGKYFTSWSLGYDARIFTIFLPKCYRRADSVTQVRIIVACVYMPFDNISKKIL